MEFHPSGDSVSDGSVDEILRQSACLIEATGTRWHG